jgi:alkanesulfonate monooxygenase SsuD/methylene tetrahydromethanopterin reductase-like flavin-dependent oxidoreductase (luciferase family)
LIQHVYVAETDADAERELVDDLTRIAEREPGAVTLSPAERTERAAAELRRLRERELLLAGSVETVANGIAFARRALGIDRYLANVWMPGISSERVRRTLRLLAEEVRPRVLASPVAGGLDVTTSH